MCVMCMCPLSMLATGCLGSADDSALTDFVHAFFCGDDPDNDSAGKFLTFNVEPSLPNDNH